MSFDRLLTLKKKEFKEQKTEFNRTIVVGGDLFALSAWKKLSESSSSEEVRLLNPFEITRDHLRFVGPRAVRGELNMRLVDKLVAEKELSLAEKGSVFYKEQKFRKFGGRSKPEPLKHDERFFLERSAEVREEDLFPFLAQNQDELLDQFNSARISVQILSIRQVAPGDLVNNEHWALDCSDGVERTCERLIWAQGPYQFLQLYKHKEKLSNEFIELAESTHRPSTLSIEFSFDREVTSRRETLFLPLSYTHEWGHFIGEFGAFENGSQKAVFSTFVDEDHSNEENVSRYIRILKNNLKKIFDKFSESSYTEYIALSEQTPCLNFDDKAFEKLSDDFENLHFIGQVAPLKTQELTEVTCEDSVVGVSHLARGLCSFHQQLDSQVGSVS